MEFLMFGSACFWILTAIAFGLMILATEKGSGIGATFTLLITIALLFFFGNKTPLLGLLSGIQTNPFIAVAIVAAYVIIGASWAIIKWYFYLIKERDKANPESNFITVPRVRDHKSEIIVWMIYWPFSMLWTLLNQPIKNIFLFIYNRIESKMQDMADKIFEPIKKREEAAEKARKEERINPRSSRY